MKRPDNYYKINCSKRIQTRYNLAVRIAVALKVLIRTVVDVIEYTQLFLLV